MKCFECPPKKSNYENKSEERGTMDNVQVFYCRIFNFKLPCAMRIYFLTPNLKYLINHDTGDREIVLEDVNLGNGKAQLESRLESIGVVETSTMS